MDRVIITLGDFLKNAGIVGMKYLLDISEAEEDSDYGITSDEQGIWLDRDFALHADWTDLYFNACVKYFGKNTVYQGVLDRIERCLTKIREDKWNPGREEKDDLKFITEKLLSNSYQNGFNIIKEKVENPEIYLELKKNKLSDKLSAEELKNRLSGFRVKLDATDNKPGWKFAEAEMRGIPVRVEIGPKDIEANQAVLARRDTGEKIVVSLDELETKVDELLKQIQSDMFEKARAHRDAHTYVATNYDEFKDIIANKPGFVKAMWCGDRACEDKIKEETTATSRCMPFAQEHLSDVCVCCGRPAKKMVYWGKAY